MLAALLRANFTVTVLTRTSSTHTFPPSVTVAPVDYTDLSSLISALHGQDALVSTVTTEAVALQRNLIDAAITAGVRRFVPSEFGSDTFNPRTRKLPVYAQKVAVQEYLVEAVRRAEVDAEAAAAAAAAAAGARKGKGDRSGDGEVKAETMTYTLVINNVFLDWGLAANFILNLAERRAELYDGGARVFSTTTLATVAKAVVGVLRKPAETKNRAVYIQDVATTQRELLALAQKFTPGEEWTVQEVDTGSVEKWAYEELRKPEGERELWPAMFGFLKRAIWAEGYGGRFERLDNEILGLEERGEEWLAEVVREGLEKVRA